jgi:hypothetical protein
MAKETKKNRSKRDKREQVRVSLSSELLLEIDKVQEEMYNMEFSSTVQIIIAKGLEAMKNK